MEDAVKSLIGLTVALHKSILDSHIMEFILNLLDYLINQWLDLLHSF
jgi:hypothetical protein